MGTMLPARLCILYKLFKKLSEIDTEILRTRTQDYWIRIGGILRNFSGDKESAIFFLIRDNSILIKLINNINQMEFSHDIILLDIYLKI